ncbi:MAG: S1C family serine protease [Verrucomicrobiales bacterium]|jgi:serine protease Do|nr:S1C family serine protease [Verrucomicrobiales bacterium]
MTRPSRFNPLTLTVLLVLLLTASVRAADTVMDSLTGEVSRIFNQVAPAVVKIRAANLDQTLAGTGFFIDNRGTLLTAYDVVQEATRANIDYNGTLVEAKIIGRDIRSGVALLKADLADTPFIVSGDSAGLKIAAGLVGVGYAYNLPVSPSFGIITGFDVRYLNNFFATTHVRCSVTVSPGQIGGPLLNSNGEVVAMMVFSVDGGRECYGIPIKSVNRIVADLREHGEARHGWVGVGVVEANLDQPYAHAVYVSQIYDRTPAANCGLAQGDQVIAIGDRRIHNPQDILDAAFFAKVGSTVPVRVIRGDRELTFNLNIIERPALPQPAATPVPYHPPAPPPAARQPVQVNAPR